MVVGCGDSNNEIVNGSTLNIRNAELPETNAYPNSIFKVKLDLFSPTTVSADNNDSLIFSIFH